MKKSVLLSLLLLLCAQSRAQDIALKEKISRLIMISADLNENKKIKELLAEKVGGIQLQWGSFSLEDTKKFTAGIIENSSGTVPFIAIDYEGGSVFHPSTLGLIELPTNMMLGAANDPANTASLFYLAGLELKKAGLNMALSPVLDVNTNPENPIIGVRSFSSMPETAATIGAAVANGFKAAGIIPVFKHFPGHGDTFTDSHKTLPVVNLSRENLLKIHVYPFKKIIEEVRPDFIMTAHVLYTALDKKYPASLSAAITEDFLKKELNYKGAVITDSLEMKAITSARSIPDAALLALKNGADMLLIGRGDFYAVRNKILKEVLRGNLDLSRINESYEKLEKIRKKYGIGEAKEETGGFDLAYREITKTLSDKAITLFRDDKKLIPLSAKEEISVVFFMPQRFSNQSINLYKSLISSGYSVKQYNFGISPSEKELKKIEDVSQNSGTLIIGSFQWGRLQNKNQKKAIKELLRSGKKTILISLMSPYDASGYPEAGAVLLTYGITDFTMQTIGEILSGKREPKGSLPINLKR